MSVYGNRRVWFVGACVAAATVAVVLWTWPDRSTGIAEGPQASPSSSAASSASAQRIHGGASGRLGPSLKRPTRPAVEAPAAAVAPQLRIDKISRLGLGPEKEAFVAVTLEDIRRNTKAALAGRTKAVTERGAGPEVIGSTKDWMDDLRSDMRTRLSETLTASEIERVFHAIGDNPLSLLAYELPKETRPAPPRVSPGR